MESLKSQEKGTGQTLDITAETCPMTFVRVRLALDRMPAGQVLEVLLKGEEPLRNVPREDRPGGATALWIRKGG